MIRIISGKYKSRRINTPAGQNTRPTTSRVREAVFSALTNAYSREWNCNGLSGARVWDAFAGSGALGFEALSRGAEVCFFTDVNFSAIKCLKANASLLGLAKDEAIISKCSCLSEDVCRKAFESVNPNILLIDAPYAVEPKDLFDIVDTLSTLRTKAGSTDKLLVYFEHSKDIFDTGWADLECVYSKTLGDIKSDIFLV